MIAIHLAKSTLGGLLGCRVGKDYLLTCVFWLNNEEEMKKRNTTTDLKGERNK